MERAQIQYIRPPDKCEYQKIIVLISQPKHMLWVLKRFVFRPNVVLDGTSHLPNVIDI